MDLKQIKALPMNDQITMLLAAKAEMRYQRDYCLPWDLQAIRCAALKALSTT